MTGDFVVVFVLESSCTFKYTPVLRAKTPENLLAKTFFRKLLKPVGFGGRFLQRVTGGTHRADDVGLFVVEIQCFAQAANMHVHRA